MSKKELTIEAGKFYKTRNGLKVEIFVKRFGLWVGCVYEVGTVTGYDWLDNGIYDDINGIDCELDIVAEWNDDDDWVDVDPSKITLDMLPMAARFKSKESSRWYHAKLYGYRVCNTRAMRYLCSEATWWDFCQVKKEK